MQASYVEMIRNDVLKWLESIRYKKEGWGKYPFNAKTIAPYSLYASGAAVRLLDDLDVLGDIDKQEKQEAAEYIKSSQDLEDGYFKDRYEDVSVYTGFHSWEEIWNQRSSAAHGLRLLGYAPRIPLPAKRYTDFSRPDAIRWLEGLNWENPGKCGEMFSSSLIAYGASLAPEGVKEGSSPFKEAFAFFEETVLDSSNGLPSRRGGSSPQTIITGLAKVLSSYIYFGRKFPFPEKVIDFVIGQQNRNGDFSPPETPNMSINYYALRILRELNYQLEGGYRIEDIQNVGNLLAHCLLEEYKKSDGGFAFGRDFCQDIDYSIRISEHHPIGDMVGTSTGYRCLNFVDEWNAGIIYGKRRRPFDL